MNQVTERKQLLFRKEALAFPKYTLSEPIAGVRLHQNESHALTQEEREEFAQVIASALSQSQTFNFYPNLVPQKLLSAYASALMIPVENLEVTAGSSQALTLLAEALFEPGRSIAITNPSFSLYANLARLYGSKVINIELDESFNFTDESLFKEDVLQANVAIICSPNNPTGTSCSKELLLRFADAFSGLLIVDEAYIEFAQEGDSQSIVKEALERNNVVVLRTLSKAWGAAGLRIGAMVATQEVVRMFRALKPPYSISMPSEILATHILEKKKEINQFKINKIIEQRKMMQALLRECSKIELLTQSDANFVFFITSQAALLERILLENGFLVRRYTQKRLENAVRISMPPESDFEFLKNTFFEVLR